MSEETSALYVRLPPKLHDDLRRLAARIGTSVNYEATVAIRAHVDASRPKAVRNA